MNKKELPNTWKPDLKPKTELEQKKLEIQKQIMRIENKMRFSTDAFDKVSKLYIEKLKQELEVLEKGV